jgi:SAM-dependent methyltransferase
MHLEVKQFLSKIKEQKPDIFTGKRVLELGSLNINGTPREFFENCNYTGIDKIEGDGVDVVSKAHEFKSKTKFDVVISTEMLEHDKYADESIKNAWKLLKKGGYLIITAANVGRAPHYQEVGEDNYYENISKERVEKWAGELDNCEILTIEEDEQKQDIRFIFKKK